MSGSTLGKTEDKEERRSFKLLGRENATGEAAIAERRGTRPVGCSELG